MQDRRDLLQVTDLFPVRATADFLPVAGGSVGEISLPWQVWSGDGADARVIAAVIDRETAEKIAAALARTAAGMQCDMAGAS